ncbi:hypothetical protein [Nocardioides sp. YIM 152588]|uniref:hypothetical protein n=1 Tax=Nocardioides sp. YIM 152588 TaxID=3158259 RepID=UPI0032E441BB
MRNQGTGAEVSALSGPPSTLQNVTCPAGGNLDNNNAYRYLKWTPSADADAVGYRIYLWANDGQATTQVVDVMGKSVSQWWVGDVGSSAMHYYGYYYGSYYGAVLSVRTLYYANGVDAAAGYSTRRNGWRQKWPEGRSIYKYSAYDASCTSPSNPWGTSWILWDPNDKARKIPVDEDCPAGRGCTGPDRG